MLEGSRDLRAPAKFAALPSTTAVTQPFDSYMDPHSRYPFLIWRNRLTFHAGDESVVVCSSARRNEMRDWLLCQKLLAFGHDRDAVPIATC